MITSTENPNRTLEERLDLKFSKPELALQALTHKSFFNENPTESTGHNETLEYLGDAVLDLSMGHFLMTEFPTDDEGRLSKKRASLVNEITLGEIALKLGLENDLRLGRGEKSSGGSRKPRILASAFEALIGALFLDQGFDQTEAFIHRLFADLVRGRDWVEDFASDYKTRLQEKIQSECGQTPQYVVISQTGPDHEKKFEVAVSLGAKQLGAGSGASKKQAEQEAARRALESRGEH